ncbi:hypothetical protein ACLB2K_059922 [Fragaria x ananassa]
MPNSIDDVTASFAASLALADKDVLDVRMEKITPKLEVPKTIEDAAIVAGDNPFVDLPLLNSTGEVRIWVSRPLDQFFIFEKVLKLAPGIVKNVIFTYENLVGMCSACKLLVHNDGVCSSKPAMVQKENRVRSLANLANPNFSQGLLKFIGTKLGETMAPKPLQPLAEPSLK